MAPEWLKGSTVITSSPKQNPFIWKNNLSYTHSKVPTGKCWEVDIGSDLLKKLHVVREYA